MAADSNAELPVWGYEVKNYIDIGISDSPKKNSPKFTLSKDFNVDYELDLYKNNSLSSYLVEHEDEEDIPVDIVRVYTWLGEDGNQTAKKAKFLLTPTPVSNGTAGEPGKLSGTLNMKDEAWTKGTWSGTAFTPAK